MENEHRVQVNEAPGTFGDQAQKDCTEILAASVEELEFPGNEKIFPAYGHEDRAAFFVNRDFASLFGVVQHSLQLVVLGPDGIHMGKGNATTAPDYKKKFHNLVLAVIQDMAHTELKGLTADLTGFPPGYSLKLR